MKRKIIIVAILSIVLYSCKKEELETTNVTGAGFCTISGEVFANYNTCNDTTMNFFTDVVDNVNVTFVLNSRYLDRTPSVDFEYEDLSYSTLISNGRYSIDLPAISTPYNVQVYFDSYNHNQTSCVINSEWVDTAWVTSTIYSDNTMNYFTNQSDISGVVEGRSIVRNINYYNQ